DGPQPYTIVTAPADSMDPAYAGRDAADVSVTNTDDDVVAAPVIAAAGSTLQAESCGAGNGVIDPDETVTVGLALVNNGTASTIDLVGTLLASGGVTAPSGPQSYGAIAPLAAAVSRPFTFTAAAACGGTLTATLHLQDGSTDLGSASFTFTLGTSGGAGGTQTFTNAAAVAIPTSGNATPYPSAISVSGLTGTVVKITASLNGFSHAF